MSDTDILLAKEIYMKYGGSHFHMEREGEYEYYQSFGISKEQEIVWLNEYQQEILTKIEKEDIVSPLFSDLTSAIRRSKDITNFERLLELVRRKNDSVDTFSQMRMVEEITDIADSFSKNNDFKSVKILVDAKFLALYILNRITHKPITVALYYRNQGFLYDIISEDRILSRVQMLMNKWENF